MKPEMLRSQYETLEEPSDEAILTIDIENDLDITLNKIISQISDTS